MQSFGESSHRLVVVSNRVSLPNRDGAKHAGGLEVVLRPVLEQNGGIWFGWSGKAVPRSDVQMCTICHKNITYVVTDLSDEINRAQFLVKTPDLLIWEIPSSRMSASVPSDSHRSPNSVDCHIDRGPLRGLLNHPFQALMAYNESGPGT
jgi:hypothetical protein